MTDSESRHRKFCNSFCDMEYRYENYIKKWKNGEVTGQKGATGVSMHIRRYLFKKYHNKCKKCSWSKINPVTKKIPLTISHKDGNWKNNEESNLELICPNCHSLTPTYGSLNNGKGRPGRKKK